MRGRVRTRGYRGERLVYDKRKWLLGKIHGVAKRRGIGDEERYRLQRDLTGVASCAAMSERQLVQVLQALQGEEGRAAGGAATKPMTAIGDVLGKAYLLKHAPRTGRDERQPDEPVTREQLARIEHLRSHVRLLSSEAWMGFCRRVIKRPWPQTRSEAIKVCEALKAMEARGWRAREVAR